jgi:membrane protein implicated in regulation of membrane protease activity
MPGSEAVFIAIGAIGFFLLLLSLLLGELFEHETELGHELEVGPGIELGHELGHGLGHGMGHGMAASEVGPAAGGSADLHTPSWLSVRVLAASMVGFGAVGFVVSSLGLPAFLSWPLAAAGFLAVGAGTYFLILKPLAAQQYNSLMSRYNYVGQAAVVTLDILPGGTGQVTFRDRQGARITQTASSDLSEAVAKGATVRIVDLAPGGVVVHHNSLSD